MQSILVLNYEFPPLGGGAAPVTHQIAKGYVKKGFKVDVVTMGYKDLPAYEIIDGIEIYRVKCFRKSKETCETYEMFSYILSALAFLSKLFKENKYDICHCHFLIPTGVVALFLKYRYKLEYIVTIHGSDIPGYNIDRFTKEHLFTRPILKLIAKNARTICSPSLFLKKLAEEKLGLLTIVHIPNGIDVEEFRIDQTIPKEPIILSTGRLVKRKGFQTIIRAVRDVELPYVVHIAGDGPYRKKLEELARDSKTSIVFHGWLEKGSKELLELYEKASIFILVSLKENASIALLEGMAAKCVIISTNVSGCPETVGEAGFLIDFDDDKSLKELLINFAIGKLKVEQYAEKAYLRLNSLFLWDKIIDSYIDSILLTDKNDYG